MLKVASVVALAAATSIGPHNGAYAAVWHVPLHRHASARTPLETVLEAHNRLAESKKKASIWTPNFHVEDLAGAHGSNGQGVLPVDFRDIRENLFAAKLAIGTPPQPVSLILDMANSDLMVINHAIGNHLYYDHAKSTTYQANGTEVQFYEGQPYELDGFVSKDHVILGSVDGGNRIEVRDHSFVELTGPDHMLGLLPPKFDGSVGIGPGRANSTGKPSIVRSMIDQQLLDRPVVGLSFGEVVAHAIFGGKDDAYSHSDFHYFPQKQHDDRWSAPVRAIVVDNKQVLSDIGAALISNIDIVFGPADQVDALADAIGAENYALPCDGPSPDITFQFGDGFQVTLTKKDYAIPQDHGWCMFGIVPVPVEQWALGLPFLHKVYTVLDYGASEGEERIGFAQIKP